MSFEYNHENKFILKCVGSGCNSERLRNKDIFLMESIIGIGRYSNKLIGTDVIKGNRSL